MSDCLDQLSEAWAFAWIRVALFYCFYGTVLALRYSTNIIKH